MLKQLLNNKVFMICVAVYVTWNLPAWTANAYHVGGMSHALAMLVTWGLLVRQTLKAAGVYAKYKKQATAKVKKFIRNEVNSFKAPAKAKVSARKVEEPTSVLPLPAVK